MHILNTDELLAPLADQAPCGLNLEYDPMFLGLERAIAGKPEVQYGDSISAAVPPEWKTVKKLSLELLSRSRDLRIVAPLLRALLALQGFAGLTEGLVLVQRLLNERWDSVHPQLDPDDDMDVTPRINALASLSDRNTTIKEIKDAELISLPGLGPLNLRMLEVELGEVALPAEMKLLGIDSIRLAIQDIDTAVLERAATLLEQSSTAALDIEAILLEKVGAAHALNLDLLVENLKRGNDFFAPILAQRRALAADAITQQEDSPANSSSQTGVSTQGIGGEISNREDVLKMIDKICSYYQKHEPSSPVPLMLLRAKKIVSMNFLEILEEIAADGVKQVKQVLGESSAS